MDNIILINICGIAFGVLIIFPCVGLVYYFKNLKNILKKKRTNIYRVDEIHKIVFRYIIVVSNKVETIRIYTFNAINLKRGDEVNVLRYKKKAYLKEESFKIESIELYVIIISTLLFEFFWLFK